jgi:hypothetical protein
MVEARLQCYPGLAAPFIKNCKKKQCENTKCVVERRQKSRARSKGQESIVMEEG